MWRIERARKLLSGIHFDAKGRKFSTQGKQRVKKQVKGKDGKTFMQTFWVKGETSKAAKKDRSAKGADFLGKRVGNSSLVIVKDLELGKIPSPEDRPSVKPFAYANDDDRSAVFRSVVYFKSEDQYLPGIVIADGLGVIEKNNPFDPDEEIYLSSIAEKVFFEPKTKTVWKNDDFPFTKYIHYPLVNVEEKYGARPGERIIDTALRLGVEHSGTHSSFSQLEANALGKDVARKGLTLSLSDPESREYKAFVSYQKLRKAASNHKWIQKEQIEVLDAAFASGAFARGEHPAHLSENKARRELEFSYLDKGKPLHFAKNFANSIIEKARKRGVPIDP